jgi:hypothetical protein
MGRNKRFFRATEAMFEREAANAKICIGAGIVPGFEDMPQKQILWGLCIATYEGLSNDHAIGMLEQAIELLRREKADKSLVTRDQSS